MRHKRGYWLRPLTHCTNHCFVRNWQHETMSQWNKNYYSQQSHISILRQLNNCNCNTVSSDSVDKKYALLLLGFWNTNPLKTALTATSINAILIQIYEYMNVQKCVLAAFVSWSSTLLFDESFFCNTFYMLHFNDGALPGRPFLGTNARI